MSADSYFAIGSAHQVCQDHAISDGDFVVLSDGCSGAKDSDWGARFITKSAYNILKQTKPGYLDKFINNVMKGAQSYVEKLELHPDCLAATFLFVYKQHKLITACVAGDGYIVAKYREKNKLKIFSYMYDTGAPWYPYYTLNEDLTRGYLEHYGHGKLISGITEIEDGKVISHNDLICAMKAEATRVPIDIMLPTDEIELVGIASDGLKSFVQQAKGSTSITNKPVGENEIIKDLFNFKTVEGQFVHRRCQRFLRDCAVQNIKHTDDFSLGVLHV
jgi:hypothetical protein